MKENAWNARYPGMRSESPGLVASRRTSSVIPVASRFNRIAAARVLVIFLVFFRLFSGYAGGVGVQDRIDQHRDTRLQGFPAAETRSGGKPFATLNPVGE
jgi:hypothetical protein